MSEWGFGVWDEKGHQRNTGIKPFLFIDIFKLGTNQVSGKFTVPSRPLSEGLNLRFVVLDASGGTEARLLRRKIRIQGNEIIISEGSASDEQAVESWLFAYYTG